MPNRFFISSCLSWIRNNTQYGFKLLSMYHDDGWVVRASLFVCAPILFGVNRHWTENTLFFFLTHPRSFCMLSKESIQGMRILLAPVMKLVDMQVLGTCAVRCVGSSPTGGNYLRSMYSTSFILALESGRFFWGRGGFIKCSKVFYISSFFFKYTLNREYDLNFYRHETRTPSTETP